MTDTTSRRLILPSDRVRTVAEVAGLGAWERTEEPDADSGHGRGWFVAGIGTLAATLAAVFALTSTADSSHSDLAWMFILIAIALAILGVLIGFVLIIVGFDHLRRGPLLFYQYRLGFVLERTKGRVGAYRYDETIADLIVYENAADDPQSQWDEREVLLTMPDGSSGVILLTRDAEFATQIATRCRPNVGSTPRPRRLNVDEAVAIEQAHIWE
ncbi:hypothetical protein [Gordonia sp. (in: high G+C Gram-positive bacteria)]|uniref:hypothetical protein n=1 Tax=Gordonia sp. (in: high G+C Gram-positive bacteria) TaxID=84139 RepID=UPI003C715C4B